MKKIKMSKTERYLFKVTKTVVKSLPIIIKGIFTISIDAISTIYIMLSNYKVYKRTGYTNTALVRMLDTLSPRQFEVFISEIYKLKGYSTQLTPCSNDYGRDVVAIKDNVVTFIECKHYKKDNVVGREIVQKLLGSTYMFKADNCVLVTTGKVHRNALEVEAMVDNLKIVDRANLINEILHLNGEDLSRIIFKLKNVS